jgi:serine/threonine-protein kinase
VREADGMQMVHVPAGTFWMGRSDGEGDSDEQPLHEVYLDAFWIDKYEVSNEQFSVFIQATGYKTDAEDKGSGYVYQSEGWTPVDGADWQHPGGPETNLSGIMNYPVLQVSWNDAKEYCEWAGGRLPTEAEWEEAARGTDGRIYPWGETQASCDYAVLNESREANGNGCGKGDSAWPVGSKPTGASPYGALNMAGNVSEWVSDWYAEDYYSRSPDSNPQGPDSGKYRVIRGGSWNYFVISARAASRNWYSPTNTSNMVGYRCVMLSTSF